MQVVNMHQSEFIPASPPYPRKSGGFLRTFIDVRGMIDDKGRRLHEASFRNEQDNDAFKVCKFASSRNGKLINQAAFRDIFSCWNDILGTQQLFREVFLSSEKPVYPFLGEIWQMSLLPLFAPIYWKLSVSELAALPAAIAGLHKIALGVPSVIELMILLDKAGSSNQTMEPRIFAEEYGLLVSESWACAGPPNMMKVFDDALRGKVESSGYNLPFQEYFETPEYAKFSFIMTCQYVCGQFFWLFDVLLTEYAYKALSANGKYDIPSQPVQGESLPTPEKRRRVILPILMQNNAILGELSSHYIEILKESERLAALSGQVEVVSRYLELLESGLEAVNKNSAEALLVLHDRLKTALFEQVNHFRVQLITLMRIRDQQDILKLPMDFDSSADEIRYILQNDKNT